MSVNLSTSGVPMPPHGGASNEARELSRRRVTPKTPITPVTPVMPINTPMLAAHIFAEGNIMEDLQLAAELGKTLLERNRELESTIKQMQSINDDQKQEIEHLSKQTAALREANDYRLGIYEHLEISVQDLEKNNQRLTAENKCDKRKIKSLSDTIEQLEVKCDDLQRSLDEAKRSEEVHRGRTLTKKNPVNDDNFYSRRSISCENTLQVSEEMVAEYSELKTKYQGGQVKIKQLQGEKTESDKIREDLEIELSCLSQQNEVLLEQLSILKEKEINFRCLEDELASLDDTTSSRLCRKCLGLADETASNQTMQDINDDLDDLDYDRLPMDGSMVKLKNGGYAWGSQESLASLGQVLSQGGSAESSPRHKNNGAPGNSLLSELLDSQYRNLIEQYESNNVKPNETTQDLSSEDLKTIINSEVDELSGPMSLMMTNIPCSNGSEPPLPMKCQRCSTCTCDLPRNNDSRPKSTTNVEEFSEVETSSSGFSEGGDNRVICKSTQTEFAAIPNELFEDAATPVAIFPVNCLDLMSPLNPCEKRFQSTPQYKTLFQDIFDVLKKTVDENEAKKAFTRSIMKSQQLVDEMSKEEESKSSAENEENENPNATEKIAAKKSPSNKKENILNSQNEKSSDPQTDTSSETTLKPDRPSSLDLDLQGSRPTSRTRRRKGRQRHDSRASNTASVDSRNSSVRRNESQLSANLISQQQPSEQSLAKLVQQKPSAEQAPEISDTKPSRCKKHRNKSKKPKLINKHLNNVIGECSEKTKSDSVLFPSIETKKLAFSKISSNPSVEIAKLRRIDKSYAEVLKKKAEHRRY